MAVVGGKVLMPTAEELELGDEERNVSVMIAADEDVNNASDSNGMMLKLVVDGNDEVVETEDCRPPPTLLTLGVPFPGSKG